MPRFIWLVASVSFTGCGVQPAVQPASEPTETVPISTTAPIPLGVDDPLSALNGKTPHERSPAYRKAPEADAAFAVLDAALERVWELPDPRESLVNVIQTAAEVDPVRTCDRVRTVAPRLWNLDLPPARHVVWASFASSVAAQDPNLRDGLLRLAVIDGKRTLAADEVWKIEPLPKGAVMRDDPRALRNFEKQMLEYDVQLWSAVLEQRADRDSAIKLASKLLADAKAKGDCQLGCINRSYEYTLAENLADLDPTLLLAVVSKGWEKKELAGFCGSQARDRWTNRNRDSITGILAAAAFENGARDESTLQIFGHYNFERAWEAVVKLPDDRNNTSFPRLRPMLYLIERWAWRDPEAALEAAEREPGEDTRRDLLQYVAGVWAYKKPEQIERAVRNQDNEVRRSWATDAAAEELEWRKKGNPPRDTKEKAPSKRGVPKLPADWGALPADLQKLLEDPARTQEADARLCELAPLFGQAGPPNRGLEVLKRVKSPYRFVNTSTLVARNLIRRAEDD